jgi:hypothetical protein
MKKCPVCNVGKLVTSGAHVYCDNCSFSHFNMTDDYIESCAAVLSSLVSNTKFKTYDDFRLVSVQHIQTHVPVLYEYITMTLSGQESFITSILDTVKTQAINLQIDSYVHGPEESGRDLVCQCGAGDQFNMVKVGELVCMSCDAKYIYSEETGDYYPEFLCGCGYASYEVYDDFLCRCKECKTVYAHDTVNKIFRRVR